MGKKASCLLLVFTLLCLAWLANCIPTKLDVSQFEPNGCECSDDMCGCCQEINLEVLNGTVCVNITYLADDLALQLTMSWNGEVLINKTISAKNPPPLCQGLPLAYACVKFYNMSYTSDHLGGCVEFEVKVLEKVDIPIGCFYFPNKARLALERGVKENSKKVVDQVKGLVKNARLALERDVKENSKKVVDRVKGLVKDARVTLGNVKENSRKTVDQVKDLVENVRGLIPNSPSDPCECNKTACSCCLDVSLVGEVCINVTEIPKEEALRFTLSVDGKVYIDETLSARNPPPFCESDITHLAYICVRFFNMSYSGKIGGCLQLECRVVEKFNVSLGCFYFNGNLRSVLAEKTSLLEDIFGNHVKEARKSYKKFAEMITGEGVLTKAKPANQLSVPRDKIVLNQQMCKCKEAKMIDCKCCAAVKGSQACIYLKHAYLKPEMALHFSVHGSKSHMTLTFPFEERPCNYWRFKEQNLIIRLCLKAASRDLADGSVSSGMCIEMETREASNKKYNVGCVYPAVKKQKSSMENFFSRIGWLG